MFKKLSIALLVLLNINSFAYLNKVWSGKGHVDLYYSTHTSKVYCPEVNFEINKNSSILSWDQFLMKCINNTGGITELDYSGFEFKLVDNEIIYRDEVVGSYSKDHFDFKITYLGDETLFLLKGEIIDNELHLSMEEFFDIESAHFKYSFILR